MSPVKAALIRGFLLVSLVMGYAQAGLSQTEKDIGLKRILPSTVYAENRHGLKRFNFDVEIENPTSLNAEIFYLELRAFDAGGNILSRAQMGGNGLPGPIAMLPSRIIPAKNTLYLFNPFPDAAIKGNVHTLKLRIFHTQGSLEVPIQLAAPPLALLEVPPLEGVSYVFSGNDLHSHHRRVSLNSEPAKAINMQKITQRFALDLTVLDPITGDIGSTPLDVLENWPAYGRTIVAPANGEIVMLRNDMPENSMNAEGQPIKPSNYADYGDDASLGNYVVIKTGDTYLLMSHFLQGSLTVGLGDQIEAGQQLGQLGFSGDTAYPHLHMQLQSGPDALTSEPIPIVFRCVALGKDAPEKQYNSAIDTGDFVSNCAR